MEATSRRGVTSSAHFRSAGELGQTTAFIPDILCAMMIASHFLLHSKDPKADRALFRDVLGFVSIDVGEGWRISAMPPAEAEIHLRDGEFSQLHAGSQQMGCRAVLDGRRAGRANRIPQRPECSPHWNAAGAVESRRDDSIANAVATSVSARR